ncbi:SET domain-containing protein [Mycena kentingensis (nom. inval.)]|nr:SET domain-containing protein [Mycena kentingensis (nom. inval.)]
METLLACGAHGVAVVSTDTSIPAETTLVRIPRQSVLSTKSSPISGLIPPNPYGRGAQLSLALALAVEIANGERSAWYGYLQSLPREIPGLFWAGGAGGTSTARWLNGTEAGRLSRGLEAEIEEYYQEVALSVFCKLRTPTPTLDAFRHACGLVSSRAFLVDAYHGLSMVPIADAFNHIQENHVHLETDYDVCPECGSLRQCLHDNADSDSGPSTETPDTDDAYEMVSNLGIPPNAEIFNTYGETLSNAQLFVQYGFVLDVNENDCITWSRDELDECRDSALLDALCALPWRCIGESELVHVERDETRRFSLNGDASISHSLWLYFALHLLHPRDDSADDLVPILEQLFRHQLAFEQVGGAPLGPSDEDDHDDKPAPFGFIPKLAGLLARLCRSRGMAIGGGRSTAELGDILDTLPADNPTRMAISLVLTERSLLDSCMASWEALSEAVSGMHSLAGR